MGEITNSSNWKRSPMGIPIEKTHYRKVGGTKHAVCDPSDGTCEIHEDEFNPDEGIVDMILHAFLDLPEDLQRGIGAALSLAGLLLLAGEKVGEVIGTLALSIGELFLEFGNAEFSLLMTES
jgi:hypothetical protein